MTMNLKYRDRDRTKIDFIWWRVYLGHNLTYLNKCATIRFEWFSPATTTLTSTTGSNAPHTFPFYRSTPPAPPPTCLPPFPPIVVCVFGIWFFVESHIQSFLNDEPFHATYYTSKYEWVCACVRMAYMHTYTYVLYSCSCLCIKT